MKTTSKSAKVRKVLLILTIIIFAISVIMGFGVCYALSQELIVDHIYVDGANIAPLFNLFGSLGIIAIAMTLIIGINLISVFMWTIYGIVMLTIIIARYFKSKRKDEW